MFFKLNGTKKKVKKLAIYVVTTFLILFSNSLKSQEKKSETNTNYESQLVKARELYYTNPQKAVELAKKLALQAELESNTDYRIKSLSSLVQGYLILGEYESALKEALVMENLAKNQNDPKIAMEVKFKLANVYDAAMMSKTSNQYANEIIEYYKTKDESKFSEMDYQLLGGAYLLYVESGFQIPLQKEMMERSLYRLKQLLLELKAREPENYYQRLAIFYGLKGKYFFKYEPFYGDSIVYYGKRIEEISIKENNPKILDLMSSYIKAMGLHAKAEYPKAIQEYNIALNKSDSLGIRSLSLEILENLISINDLNVKKEKAEELTSRYLKQKKYIDSTNSRFNKIILEYEKENRNQAIKNRRDFNLKIIVFFIFAFLGGLAVFFWNRKRKRAKKLNSSIIIQEKISETELQVQKLKDTLTDVESKSVENQFEELKEMIQNRDPLFMNLFDKIYPNFSKSILNKNPEITLSEIQYCALVKLNYSTKEIADVLGVSVNSIDVKRYRLKKKLKLDSSVNLSIWLINLS